MMINFIKTSASNPFIFNNSTVHFHMSNQVQNVSSSVNNSRKRRRRIYSSDSSQEKTIKKTETFCFSLNTDSCHWTIKFPMNMFYWCCVYMLKLYILHFTMLWFFKVLENFVVDLKQNIFMKAAVSQNVMFYLSCRFSGWVKAFRLVYLVTYFSFSKNLQKNTHFNKWLRRSAVDETDKLLLCW